MRTVFCTDMIGLEGIVEVRDSFQPLDGRGLFEGCDALIEGDPSWRRTKMEKKVMGYQGGSILVVDERKPFDARLLVKGMVDQIVCDVGIQHHASAFACVFEETWVYDVLGCSFVC